MELFKKNFTYIESKKNYIGKYEEVLDRITSDGLSFQAKKYLNDEYIEVSELSKENCKKISLTTSCMDRNDFLLKSFDTWIKLPFKEIIIIDWSSKVPVIQTLQEKYGRSFLENSVIPIIVKRIDNEKYYNHSKVRNIKLDLCSSDWILCIDCDVMLNKKFANFFKLENPDRYFMNMPGRSSRGLFGTALFSKKMYNTVEKFDENLKYWGSEDVDFYKRADAFGFKWSDIRSITMVHQDHDDDLRSKNTPYESIWRSHSENNYKIAKKTLKGKDE